MRIGRMVRRQMRCCAKDPRDAQGKAAFMQTHGSDPGSTLRPRPVVLEGDVVRLEPLRIEHAAPLARVGLDGNIWRWMLEPVTTPAGMHAYVQAAIEEEARGAALPFAIVPHAAGIAIGSTRFGNIAPEHRRLEIGWTWLAPAYQRTAVNTETKLLLLAHAFETLGAQRVELKTDACNERSRAAILRIGATYEGTFRKHMIVAGGRVRDTAYYAIVDSDWPDVKAKLSELRSR